jgi:hypothetical protein
MTTARIQFEISSSDSTCPLGVEVWIDQQQIFDTQHLADTAKISCDISEHDAEHELRVVLKNKLFEHTKIDANGLIVQDVMINVGSFVFEEIDVNQVVQDLAVYTHNFNGSSEEIQDQFFGSMGCNGTMSLKFTTPIYLWLLENL